MTVHDTLIFLNNEVPHGDFRELIATINREQRAVARSRRWRFYQTLYSFDLTPAYTTGTIDVTEGATTVTGTDTVWTSAMEGRKIKVSGGSAVFTVDSVTSATELELDREYSGDTDTGLGYIIWQETYNLPSDIMFLKAIRNAATSTTLEEESPTHYIKEWALLSAASATSPCSYTAWGQSNGVWQFKIRTAPEDAEQLDVYYYRKPTDVTAPASELDVPEYLEEVIQYRLLLNYLARFSPDNRVHIQMVQGALNEAMATARHQDNKLTPTLVRNERTVL